MKKIFTVLLLGSALSLPACDDKKDEKKADDKAKTDKKDDKKAEDKKAEEKKAEEKKEEAKAEDTKAADAAPAESVGAPECDELIKKTKCSWEKAGAAIPAEAKKAFEDGTKAWAEALKNEASKAATIDVCKKSLEAGKAGFDAVGC